MKIQLKNLVLINLKVSFAENCLFTARSFICDCVHLGSANNQLMISLQSDLAEPVLNVSRNSEVVVERLETRRD